MWEGGGGRLGEGKVWELCGQNIHAAIKGLVVWSRLFGGIIKCCVHRLSLPVLNCKTVVLF